MVDVDHIHGLQESSCVSVISQGKIEACICKRQARAANDAIFVIPMIEIAEGKYIHFVPGFFEGAFVQVDIGCDAADIWLVGICHHSDSHELIVQASGKRVNKDEG